MESKELSETIQKAQNLLLNLTDLLKGTNLEIFQRKALLESDFNVLKVEMSKIIDFSPYKANFEDSLFKQLESAYDKRTYFDWTEKDLSEFIRAEDDQSKLAFFYSERCQFFLTAERYFPALEDLTKLIKTMKETKPELELLKGKIQLLELGLYTDAEKTLQANLKTEDLFKFATKVIASCGHELPDWAYENYFSQLLRECAHKNEYEFHICRERESIDGFKCRIKPLLGTVLLEKMVTKSEIKILCKPQLEKEKGGISEPDFVILKRNAETSNWDFLILDCKHYKNTTYTFKIETMLDYAEDFKYFLKDKAGICLNKVFIATNRTRFHQFKIKKVQIPGEENWLPVFGIPLNFSLLDKKVGLLKRLIQENFNVIRLSLTEEIGKEIHKYKEDTE